jgi:hypothetical protein
MSEHPRPARDAQQASEPEAPNSAPRHYGLAREIVVILAVKASLLFAIWYLFFSAPQAQQMQLPPERMQQRLIETPAAVTPSSPRSFNPGPPDHATH